MPFASGPALKMTCPIVHVAPLAAAAVFVFVPKSVCRLDHERKVSVDLQTAVALTTMLLARTLLVVFFEQAENTSAATAGPAIPTSASTVRAATRTLVFIIRLPFYLYGWNALRYETRGVRPVSVAIEALR